METKTDLRTLFTELLAEAKGPFLAEEICFEPIDHRVDVRALYADLKIHLRHFHRVTEENPFANPIVLLAIHLARLLERGEVTFSALEQLIQYLSVYAFVARAERLHHYVGEIDPVTNLKTLDGLLRQVACPQGQKGPVSLEKFAQAVSDFKVGVVVTAHPTFALKEELLRILAELASGRNVAGVPLSKDQVHQLLRQALRKEHLSESSITLEMEHKLALESLANLQRAFHRVYELIFRLARELYPKEWFALRPRLITMASWVGYDLDGRKDIAWTQSFAFRLEERKKALSYYRDAIQNIIDLCPIEKESESLRGALAAILKTISDNLKDLDEEIEIFAQASLGDEEGLERLRYVAKKMYAQLSQRLVRPEKLVQWLDQAINEAHQNYPDLALRLCLLRTEIENYGLGVGHIHVRLNAKQIHNAIRSLIGMETDPEDPSSKKTYLKALDKLLAQVKPVRINFGSLVAERTTAKRLFMLVTQILKYIDASTPIRFLIAETESPFTSIAALYFAKLFGVEDKIDISPLFETPKALARGAKIVDEMLANDHFRAYVKARGRLCVQTGFSDAGRLLGQTAASFAIETFRRQLARVLAKYDLKGVELIIFNTHGESIGRGAHPAHFRDRLAYVMSPRSRWEISQVGVVLKEELSFQGGDGYIYFLNPNLALAVVCRLLEQTIVPPEPAPDPFYEEWDYVFEFFTTIRQFNERIMADPDYAILLHDYGRHFLYPTGSRAFKRQYEVEKVAPVTSASQIRAIPHNAILHQLGLLANTIGGVGQAIKKNPDQFLALLRHSPRFRLLVSMVEYAFCFSDFYAFNGYLHILNPGFWLMVADKAPNPQHAQELREVADQLERVSKHLNLAKVGRVFYRDWLDLEDSLSNLLKTQDNRKTMNFDEDLEEGLEVLHALRLAIIYQIFTLAVQVPEFSPQRGTTRDEIVERLLHLDVESAVGLLRNIFPLLESLAETKDFGEEATYHTEQYLGYLQEHQNIFRPLAALYKLMRRISGGVTHAVGAFG